MLLGIARKLAWAVVTIWAVVTLTFLLFNTLPGDPARVMAGPQARPADVERIRSQLGIDRPLWVRYGRYLGRLVTLAPDAGPFVAAGAGHGSGELTRPSEAEQDLASSVAIGPVRLNLGESYLRRKPVTRLLADALPPTLLVGCLALFIQVAAGTFGGVVAAYRKHTVFDWGTVLVTLLGISAPTFVTGLVLQHFLARQLRWFPLDGYGDGFWEIQRAAFLPALTLGIFGASYYTRLVRDEMIGLLGQDYVRTARAKGASERRVVLAHALRNALVPLATVVGLNMGTIVGGAIVTEKIFRWPGIGTLSVEAIVDRDGPVVMGVVLLFSSVVVLSNLLVDVTYALLDPRVRER